ncbi:hypothetical protein [Streptomyces sp. PSKA30]|uniref:DUF4760 domain-containing protein n=1 Tax=Streptomyces sp. PSKA30 TaxID=2874597 RepID=UPI001CD17A28|nr:hypothetical protein [Streptomyces sp. PSKA30]MBZ9643956.1 hypothetical protein [Streptomyces sp. PSKA30]
MSAAAKRRPPARCFWSLANSDRFSPGLMEAAIVLSPGLHDRAEDRGAMLRAAECTCRQGGRPGKSKGNRRVVLTQLLATTNDWSCSVDASTLINIGAVVVSISALAVSSWLARNQFLAQRHGNHVGPIVELLTEFRSLEFHRNYAFIRDELPTMSSDNGISGLDEDVQRQIYDVGYFFQLYAILAYLDIMDERFVNALLRRRYIETWAALKPFVHKERELLGLPDSALLNILEVFVDRLEAGSSAERQRLLTGRHRR